jgi:hypothetical protein
MRFSGRSKPQPGTILCVPEAEIGACSERYEKYVGTAPCRQGAAHVFELQESCVTLVTARALETLLPGEKPSALPALVSYAVAVREIRAARWLLESNSRAVREAPHGDSFVPADAALGARVIFRQAG